MFCLVAKESVWEHSFDKSVFLDVKFCEELDNAVHEKRKQDEYNTYIENCDLFILLTDSECGNYTLEEFEVACNGKKSTDIMVFCRKSSDPLSDNVNQLKNIAEDRGKFIFYTNYKKQVEPYIHSHVEGYIEKMNSINGREVIPKKLTFA